MAETDFLEAAEQAARLAGKVLGSWSKKFTVSEKSPANLVTEADFAAQEAIFDHIHTRWPDHGFLGEEGLAVDRTDSPFRWVIDPLDGTSNYVHGFPYYAVSIALEQDGEALIGVVFDPNRDEMFAVIRGHKALLNGQPIRPTEIGTLQQAMLVASLPVAVTPNDPAVARFLRVIPHAQTVQRTGSAALNLVYVAAGRIEAFWSSSLKPWDMAAGALIVREAGGRVSQMDGSEFAIEVPNVLASNGTSLHVELQQLLI